MNEFIYEMTKDLPLREFIEYRKNLKNKTRILKGWEYDSCPFIDMEGEEYGERI